MSVRAPDNVTLTYKIRTNLYYGFMHPAVCGELRKPPTRVQSSSHVNGCIPALVVHIYCGFMPTIVATVRHHVATEESCGPDNRTTEVFDVCHELSRERNNHTDTDMFAGAFCHLIFYEVVEKCLHVTV